jgi:hypothetical protein
MNIQQAIQSSANVVRVTNIVAGDVYKRFDANDDCTFYGIVKNVHNSGEEVIVEAVEYRKRYGSLDINLKNLRGAKDYTIFPASPEDLSLELDGIVTAKEKEIEKKREEIVKLEREVKDIESLVSGELTRELKKMSYTELSQEQYNQKKLAATF